ncbi:MAG TPA: Fic family protein [Phycisphaerae bacterium]|nr:Fic family protein [Phycisphaerae bacterium]
MKDHPPILSLRPDTFASITLPLGTSWLLSDCMEYRGKQDLWIRQKPEALAALREQATIQSVESSNRIEGITVAPGRLRSVVLGESRPKDRSEEELAGYRRALDWIYGRKSRVPIDMRTMLHLHALCQAGAGDAGKLKARDNEIIEVTQRGEHLVRYRPTPAKHTRAAMKALAAAHVAIISSQEAPSLLITATTILDFLCIHPFRDGNGRVSRLLTTLLLQQHGFVVGRFISLERVVEDSKEDYYRILRECSQGWSEGKNPVLPWWNYFLTVLRRAYAEFAERVERAETRTGKSDLIRQAAMCQVGPFTLADLQSALPSVSAPLIKKVLADLKAERKLTLTGRGRSARWLVRSVD